MSENIGNVIQIAGPAVDVQFTEGAMPPIYQALRVVSAGFTVPSPINVILEVQQHLGEGRVRCVAMEATDGMVRGMQAIDQGGPISAPVGRGTLGRVMNVIGEPVDNLGPIAFDKRMPIHRLAPAFDEQWTTAEMFETGAEYCRDEEGSDTLLFIDNIFRFTQAGSEVSALLGRMPSAVGYQPNLATEMGELQERITSTKKGSVTSVQAIYVPADDLTDPAPATTFAHLDATTVLSRALTEIGIYPAVDPLGSTSRILDPRIVGQEHYDVAQSVKRTLQTYKDLQDIIAILGIDELTEDQKLTVARARKIQKFLSQPFHLADQLTGAPGRYVKVADTVKGLKAIVEGKYDEIAEEAFYMKGTIDEVMETAEKMKGTAA